MRGRSGRPGLSAEQKLEVWARWRAGESLSEIAIVLGRHAGSIHSVVARQGGYAPPLRRRSGRALSLSERESISRGLAAGMSLRAIARDLARAPSTISRELSRHGDRAGYRATVADDRALDAARRPRRCR